MNTLNKFSPDAKVWIYQANRTLNLGEENKISEKLSVFISSWQSHGTALKATFEILEHRFIAIAVDENQASASGCSIDKSVGVIREIEDEFRLGLLDRGGLSYIDPSGEIVTIVFSEIKKSILALEIQPETIVFNTNLNTVGELDNNWKILAKETWLNRLFPKNIVA